MKMRGKITISGIIFILLFCGIAFTYDFYARANSENHKLKQQLELLGKPNSKQLDSQLDEILNSLSINKYEAYAKIKTNYKKFTSHGVRTIQNYKNEKDIKKFRGSSSGAYAVYQISPQTFCYAYIIKDTAFSNGNLILSVSPNDFTTEQLKLYSFYKIGNFFLKLDVYSSNTTLPSSDLSNLYRFTSQLKSGIEKALIK